MFKLRNVTILCTKLATFKFDACHRLKSCWDGACLPWCNISSSFQNSLKVSRYRGYEFLEFWCWNLVLEPNFLYRWNIWTPGRPIQQPGSSTLKQSILNEPWPTGHDSTSGPCSHMASFLHDRTLVVICRWRGGFCLPTVVSVSIPRLI